MKTYETFEIVGGAIVVVAFMFAMAFFGAVIQG